MEDFQKFIPFGTNLSKEDADELRILTFNRIEMCKLRETNQLYLKTLAKLTNTKDPINFMRKTIFENIIKTFVPMESEINWDYTNKLVIKLNFRLC